MPELDKTLESAETPLEETPEVTPEKPEEKKEVSTEAQKRIDTITSRAKAAEYEASEERRKREEAEARIAELEKKPEEVKIAQDEKIVLEGREYFTDSALWKMINTNQMTREQADVYARDRNRAEDRDKIRQDFKKDEATQTFTDTRKADIASAVQSYPWLKDKSDPRYKLANEIYARDGMHNIAKGLSKTCREAEAVYAEEGVEDRETVSQHLSAESPSPSKRAKGKKVTLTEHETDIAHQMWPDLKPEEAEAKALKAKKLRLGGE